MTQFFETIFKAHPSREHREIYGRYEKLYTINDFVAALFFLVGSVMFFYSSLQEAATWCFTLGSINFMLRPTIKLVREYHLAALPLPGDDRRLQRDN